MDMISSSSFDAVYYTNPAAFMTYNGMPYPMPQTFPPTPTAIPQDFPDTTVKSDNDSPPQLAKPRKFKSPEEEERWRRKRSANNEAARKSRLQRRDKEMEMKKRIGVLEHHLNESAKEIDRLQKILMSHGIFFQPAYQPLYIPPTNIFMQGNNENVPPGEY